MLIQKIQSISSSAKMVAGLLSTIDIMTLVSRKPIKTVKRIYKNDWEQFIAVIEAMNTLSTRKIHFIAWTAANRYRSLSGDNNWKLYRFWDGVARAFDK